MVGLIYIFVIEFILHKIQIRREEKAEEAKRRAKREKKRQRDEEKGAQIVEVTEVSVRSGKKNNNKRGK